MLLIGFTEAFILISPSLFSTPFLLFSLEGFHTNSKTYWNVVFKGLALLYGKECLQFFGEEKKLAGLDEKTKQVLPEKKLKKEIITVALDAIESIQAYEVTEIKEEVSTA